ncbi:MAG: matrixin family metalloprotease [Nanoarchaeota archaeon]|nr:matrixin family metalloprotease [Nanoarchaeota archaeon]
MKWGNTILIFLNILMLLVMSLYFFMPQGDISFLQQEKSPEFNLGNNSVEMQFYENMRFPEKTISYAINDDCNLRKRQDMTIAFETLANLTVLDFYQVPGNEQITVACQEKSVVEEGMFIAGEGGPTDITDGTRFKVILNGNILLIKDSDCERPNVAIHELLHVLGFNHSENENNILYPVSRCKQTIGDEILKRIADLYSTPTLPDLSLNNVSTSSEGRKLNVNLSIRNEGLKKSSESQIQIYADDKMIKEIKVDEIEIGNGIRIELQNLWLSKITIKQLRIVINSTDSELSDTNNQVLFIVE